MSEHVENWLPISGWTNYEVSNLGRVRSLGAWRPARNNSRKWFPSNILQSQLANGRLIVTLCDPCKKQTTYGVAYLVLCAFVRHPNEGEIARHYHDPDPLNCKVENLCWGTHSDNAKDVIRHKGKYHTSKLTPAQVLEIRRLLSEGQVMQKTIAERFGVSGATVTYIKQGKSQKLV